MLELPATAEINVREGVVGIEAEGFGEGGNGGIPAALPVLDETIFELVHHVQESRALPYPCLAARESDAYHLQAAWLRQQGVPDPLGVMGVNEFTIVVASMCSEE